ncbi:hypothetical protein [Mycolicibacterium sp. A43C]
MAGDESPLAAYLQARERYVEFHRRNQMLAKQEFAWALGGGLCAVAAAVVGVLNGSPDSMSLWLAILGAVLGALTAATGTWSLISSRRRAGRTTKGLLAIEEAVKILTECQPNSFVSHELRLRRKVNRQVEKLAAAIEAIPSALGANNLATIRLAQERAEGMRALQLLVAVMSSDADKQLIIESLQRSKVLYDSGQWLKLEVVKVGIPERTPLGYRIGWGLLSLVSFGGIVAVVILSALQWLPPVSATTIPFVLAVILIAALNRLGVSTDSVKQVVDVASKAQGSLGLPQGPTPDHKPLAQENGPS